MLYWCVMSNALKNPLSNLGINVIKCTLAVMYPISITHSSASFTLQVQLLYELFLSWSSTWARLHRHGILRQTSNIPDPPAGAAPSSPVRSSAGTALPDTSTCSPSADFGSPTEVGVCHSCTFFNISPEFMSQLWFFTQENLLNT